MIQLGRVMDLDKISGIKTILPEETLINYSETCSTVLGTSDAG